MNILFKFAAIVVLFCNSQPVFSASSILEVNRSQEINAPLGGSQRRLLLLLDRTGSMSAIRADGRSRCFHSRAQALIDIGNFFEQYPGSLVSVWTFGADTEIFNLTGGYVGSFAARNAVANLTPEGCISSCTALSQAICSASADLAQFSSPIERQLMVSSDGGENCSIGECAGIGSNSAVAPFDSGSWQNKAFLKLTQIANRSVVLSRFWDSALAQNSNIFIDLPLQPTTIQDGAFFRSAAEVTGGNYAPVPDSAVVLPPPFFPTIPLFTNSFEQGASIQLIENFENVTTLSAPNPDGSCALTGLNPVGWFARNNSQPLGGLCAFQGNTTVWTAQSGSASSYVGMNFNSTTSLGNISTWLVTPFVNFGQEASLEFWVRAPSGATIFPDRLQLRISTSQSATPDVGVDANSIGTFTNLILDINPQLGNANPLCGSGFTNPFGGNINGFPREQWCKIKITNSGGIPNSGRGRFAFRYVVANGGASGTNSDYIGIDSLLYQSR